MDSISPSSSSSTSSSSRPKQPTRGAPPTPIEIGVAFPDTSTTVASPISEEQQHDEPPSDLTPLRAHYLKKSLIQLQFNQELDLITSPTTYNTSTLSYLGPPFSPPLKDAPFLDLPLLRYIFRQFVLTFPFLAAAPKDFYPDKLQPFAASVLSRNLSPTSVLDDGSDGAEKATRMKLLAKLERNLSLFVGAATKLAEQEEVVRLNQADLDRLEALAKKRQARNLKNKDIFDVNIVSVRTVVDKGRVRSRAHEEFIIRTRRSKYEDVFVSRRYGDFRTLANELRKAHPEENIRPPPAKDRTIVSAPATPTATSPMSSIPSRQSAWDEYLVGSLYLQQQQQPPNVAPSRLAREKNRLTLRSYLHSLLTSSTIASSPVLRSFLLSGAIRLNAEEMEDAKKREEADRVRDEGRKKFAKEVASRVEGLRDAVKSVKGDIMGKDGLTRVFATIKVTPDLRGLPANYQGVIEWARISLASTIFHQFIASDNASETLAGLKRIHGLMPYFMLKAALKISNPIGMIRSVLDLFLAQPFGGKSLLQRMFTSSLTEEVKVLEVDIEAVKEKVDDPMMCAKIKQFVYAPREIQNAYKADAAAENMNLLTVVLRSPDEPSLSRPQIHRLAKAQRAHAAYLRTRAALDDSDDDDGPHDEDAWLLEDLKVLTHLYSKLRDREQLIALIFEGFTAELLKDIITIFYAPLAQVYRAASIGDSISDLQSFINDLIRTVEQVEEMSQEDPHSTVQAFINLVQRHEHSFYNFVHKVHSKGEGLFDSLMRWIELFLTVIREGLGSPISLEFLLPHTGQARTDILAEVDKVALYHYKLKVLYEDKLRRRFVRTQAGSGNDADAEDVATQQLVNGVVGEINFGELIQGDADEVAAEDTEGDDSGEEESESEESESGSGSSEDDDDDEDEDDESGEESEKSSDVEVTPQRKPTRSDTIKSPTGKQPPSRSATLRGPPPYQTQQRSTHQGQSPIRSDSPNPPIPRKRSLSLSLRSSRSMNFLTGGNSSGGRRSHDVPPTPPLPPLPKSALSSSSSSLLYAQSKPLPPSPLVERGVTAPIPGLRSNARKREESPSPPPLPPKNGVKGKKKSRKPEGLKPPELVHIPMLLPVFKEMMRPLLRPRQRTEPLSPAVMAASGSSSSTRSRNGGGVPSSPSVRRP